MPVKNTMYCKVYLVIFVLFCSCKEKKTPIDFDSSIAFKVYQSQSYYLNDVLSRYAQLSQKGDYYFQQVLHLDTLANELRNKIELGGLVFKEETDRLFEHFEKTIKEESLVDRDALSDLKTFPVESVADINFLLLFFKNCYVTLLLDNKLLPFNTWSTMASSENWVIRNGEAFEVSLANTAYNSVHPHEWYQVKDLRDNLDIGNIIDTLRMNEIGVINFSTRSYKMGENKLFFISRLNTPANNKIVSKEVKFIVR